MKKLLLLAFLVAFAGTAAAQQTAVRVPNSKINVPQYFEQTAPAQSPFGVMARDAAQAQPAAKTSHARPLRKSADIKQQELIGFMANTYGWMRDDQEPVACDPATNNVAIIYRGNDRSASGDGNSLYVRYSSDQGGTWGNEGGNIATSASPRYPNIFLPNTGGNAKTAVTWAQVGTYGNGQTGFRDVYSMKADIGGGNPSYGLWPTPPIWGINSHIVADNNGDLYTTNFAYEPNDGTGTGELYLWKSVDGGQNWNMVSDVPIWTTDQTPVGYAAFSMRFDISPDGSTFILAYAQCLEITVGAGSVNWIDESHEITWSTSTDKGMNWSSWQRLQPAVDLNLSGPFANAFKMSTELDVVLDIHNTPHFLIIGTSDINPLTITDDLLYVGEDTLYNLKNVDSTFMCEITQEEGNWKLYPIGPSRKIYISRLSFTAGRTDDTPWLFQPEGEWARNKAGDKIFAKWVTPQLSWHLIQTPTGISLVHDTVTNVYINGRHVDSRTSKGGWTIPWNFDDPFANDSLADVAMRVTDQEEVACKFTKMSSLAGNAGNANSLHIGYVEWGVGENLDDDAVFSDQTIWYIKDVTLAVQKVLGVERVDNTPGNFSLSQNFPNPFNPSTQINFTLPSAGMTTLRVFNTLGQEVGTIVNERLEAGTHQTSFDASSLPSGMYMYRLESGSFSSTKKMMLTK